MPKNVAAIRHTDIVVKGLNESLRFYRGLLRPLGWRIENEIKGERGERVIYIAGPAGFVHGAIGLRQCQHNDDDIPYDRYDLGLHHLAINVDTRKDVNERAEWLRRSDYKIESGPSLYYNDSYYAVFFYDPDGIKLEIVCGG